MKKRRVFSNLRRLYVKGRDRKIRDLLRSYVCEYVELYFQAG